MANDLTQRPWLLDTTANPIKSSLGYSTGSNPGIGGLPQGVRTVDRTFLQGIVYYGVNAGDTATFQDSRGRQVMKLFCQTANQPVGEANFIREGVPVLGLALTQISSGYCEVYVV